MKAYIVKSNVKFIEKEIINPNSKNIITGNPLSNKSLGFLSERSDKPEESLISKEVPLLSKDNPLISKENPLLSINTDKNSKINEKPNEKNPNDFGTPKTKKIYQSTKKLYDSIVPKNDEENNALLNLLKVEYYKLKNELDILKTNYYNLRNHVDLEENQAEDLKEENNKNKYPSINSKEIKLSPAICVVLFILAIILGFYLS